jgi:hypothetical protein
LKIEILNWKKDGKHKVISKGYFSIKNVIDRSQNNKNLAKSTINLAQSSGVNNYKNIASYKLGGGTLEDISMDKDMNSSMVNNQSLADLDKTKLVDIETYDKKGKFRGKIYIKNFEVMKYHSLIDFFNSGLNLSTAFIIDFTGSNGDPSDSRSLHYTKSGLNQYQKIIHMLGSILKDYDSKKKTMVFGFGAGVKNFTNGVRIQF